MYTFRLPVFCIYVVYLSIGKLRHSNIFVNFIVLFSKNDYVSFRCHHWFQSFFLDSRIFTRYLHVIFLFIFPVFHLFGLVLFAFSCDCWCTNNMTLFFGDKNWNESVDIFKWTKYVKTYREPCHGWSFWHEKRARIQLEWQRAFKKEQRNNNKNMFLFITPCNQKMKKKMIASLAIKKRWEKPTNYRVQTKWKCTRNL